MVTWGRNRFYGSFGSTKGISLSIWPGDKHTVQKSQAYLWPLGDLLGLDPRRECRLLLPLAAATAVEGAGGGGTGLLVEQPNGGDVGEADEAESGGVLGAE